MFAKVFSHRMLGNIFGMNKGVDAHSMIAELALQLLKSMTMTQRFNNCTTLCLKEPLCRKSRSLHQKHGNLVIFVA
jgi:hypothetical protein